MLELDRVEGVQADSADRREPLVLGAFALLRTAPQAVLPVQTPAEMIDRIAALCADLGLSSGGEAADTAVREVLADAWAEEQREPSGPTS
jgi:hypothetical protein